jgi:hypothetical protein
MKNFVFALISIYLSVNLKLPADMVAKFVIDIYYRLNKLKL